MASNNARLIEKDAFAASALLDAQGGDSEVIDLNGASKFSCQGIYTVKTYSAAVVTTANIFISTDPDHPSQFKKVGHGLTTGLKVQATTAGTLATPLVVLTDYYVIKIDDDYFALASSLNNALAGTKIAITNVGVTSTTLTPVALAGASVTFKHSNDGVNWTNIQSATSISSTGSVMLTQANVSYRYFKATKAITAGGVDLEGLVLVIGPAV